MVMRCHDEMRVDTSDTSFCTIISLFFKVTYCFYLLFPCLTLSIDFSYDLQYCYGYRYCLLIFLVVITVIDKCIFLHTSFSKACFDWSVL